MQPHTTEAWSDSSMELLSLSHRVSTGNAVPKISLPPSKTSTMEDSFIHPTGCSRLSRKARRPFISILPPAPDPVSGQPPHFFSLRQLFLHRCCEERFLIDYNYSGGISHPFAYSRASRSCRPRSFGQRGKVCARSSVFPPGGQ